MTIALKIGNDESQIRGFIYLDAVTVYTKNLSGKVTSFPVDSGVDISDHFIPSNQKFAIEGVITESDVTGVSNTVELDGQKPLNARPRPGIVSINGAGSGGLLSLLPDVISQFFDKGSVSVSSDSWQTSITPQVEALLFELMSGVYYNQVNKKWRNKMVTTVLYEMNGSFFSNAHTDLVITDVSIREDAESGEALVLSLSLEKVRLVSIDQTDMPKLANAGVSKKVAKTEKKGTPGTVGGLVDTANAANNIGAKDLMPKVSPAKVESTLAPAIATARSAGGF